MLSGDVAVLSMRSPASTHGSRAASSERVPRSRETTTPPEPQAVQQAQPSTSKPKPPNRRERRTEIKDERRIKKMAARMKQTRATNDQSTSESASPAADSPVFAEASIQEALLKDDPELTDIDHSPSLFVAPRDRYPVRPLPSWYLNIKDAGQNMNKLRKNRPQALASLESLKNCVGRCEGEMKQVILGKLFDELREYVHRAEFLLLKDQSDMKFVLKFVLKLARILSPENGLPRIFKEEANFPSDIKADAYQLYARYIERFLSGHPSRYRDSKRQGSERRSA